MYTKKKVAGAFVVVSYLMGEFNFELRKDVVLEVSSAHISQDTIHVRAVAIPLETYYRLDGTIPMSWPIGEVLHPAKLNARKLGVYGWIRSDPVIYVPLRITQRGSPLGGDSSDKVIISLRPTAHIENVEWRYAPVVNGKCSKSSEWKTVYNTKFGLQEKNSRFRRGNVVRIDLSDVKKGELCLEIIADEEKSAHEVTVSIRVINPETR